MNVPNIHTFGFNPNNSDPISSTEMRPPSTTKTLVKGSQILPPACSLTSTKEVWDKAGLCLETSRGVQSIQSEMDSADHDEKLFNIHGRCGIIGACLIDPLSQLISKIMGLREDEVNSVGFYYEAELHGVNKTTVMLFNIYDNDPIPWLRLGYTMDLLLASPFVTRITFYPLVDIRSSKQSGALTKSNSSQTGQRTSGLTSVNTGSIMTRNCLKTDSMTNRYIKIDEAFRAIVVQTIGLNAKAIHDKNMSYTALLLKIGGITGEEVDILTNNIITGYSLVNKVLLNLMGIEKADLVKIASSVVPCPLLRRPISITAPRESTNESDVKYIIEDSRREITKLVAIFVDLFTTHELFRSNILSLRSISGSRSKENNIGPKTKIPVEGAESRSPKLDILFANEYELVSHIVGGLHNGIVSSQSINEIIRDLVNERFNLGNYQQLPIITTPKRSVQVTDENVMCTFKQPIVLNNTDPLRDLGVYIGHIAEAFNNPETLSINLGGIISAYNEVVQAYSHGNLEKITIPHIGGAHTISRSAVVTIPGTTSIDMLTVPVSDTISRDGRTISVPMYNCNLTSLNDEQLLDILVYIDSLRSTDGTSDTRFSNLQNEITYELARRTSKRY